jgi:hypothetical protein
VFAFLRNRGRSIIFTSLLKLLNLGCGSFLWLVTAVSSSGSAPESDSDSLAASRDLVGVVLSSASEDDEEEPDE